MYINKLLNAFLPKTSPFFAPILTNALATLLHMRSKSA